ncbi:hypothetical protein [Duganella sp. LjRoot269]|jgi:hypothetical protein|uniref:hypothetical protein n=1 Tax=Duganella sp. LjRoot269 TaxID=3342305 RepID=UPI003ECFC8FA
MSTTWYFEVDRILARSDDGTVLAVIGADEQLGPGMEQALNVFTPISDMMLKCHAVAVNDAPS